MLSSNRQPKLSRTSPKKCEIPGASFIRRRNPRKHRSIRTAKKEITPVLRSADPEKTRLAPLTIKPPKLRKNAAQSREKRRFCRQRPAAAAQHPKAHPARDHANTPRQQLKKRLTRYYPPPGASKKTRNQTAKRRKCLGIHRNLLGGPPQCGNTTRSFAHKNQAV